MSLILYIYIIEQINNEFLHSIFKQFIFFSRQVISVSSFFLKVYFSRTVFSACSYKAKNVN